MHHSRNQATEPAGHLERAVYHSVRAGMGDPTSIPQPAQRKYQNRWFEDIAAPKDTAPQPNQDPQGQQPQPLHGLKLVIKEEVLPMKDQPEFPSLELLAARGLLASDTWKCKRAQVFFFRPTPSWLPPGRSTCLRVQARTGQPEGNN